jgi:Kef-type K+ transport system membrane component KefB
MKKQASSQLRAFLFELVIYAALVVAYFFLVLHFLGGWVARLHADDRKLYAIVALLLIIGQGVLLETITTALLNFIRSRTGR